MTADAPKKVYPLSRVDDDPRFTMGLLIDVRDVLVKHGYPEPTGHDLVELQQALFRFVYRAAPESFTCPRCGRTSHNANDVRERFCGACNLAAPKPVAE